MELAQIFKLMAQKQASDLFFSAGSPLSIKIEGEILPVNAQPLDADTIKKIAYALMTGEQIQRFEATLEMNFALTVPQAGRFRVNIFRQRNSVAMVIRYLRATIPSLESLRLPVMLKELAGESRGLVLVVGATGCGKSTTLASMIDYRNSTMTGHILAIEDPIEYVHSHKKSIVNQREVGTDTVSYANGLQNAMREAANVLLIGEIRDVDTMRQTLLYTQTGHLCLATLHANNAGHALTRIVNFFPQDQREYLLHDLSLSLRAILSQRLVKGVDGKLLPAVELLLNSLHIAELIRKGQFEALKEAIGQSLSRDSQTFEQALLKLFKAGQISREEALRNADSRSDLIWLMNNSAAGGESPAPGQPGQ